MSCNLKPNVCPFNPFLTVDVHVHRNVGGGIFSLVYILMKFNNPYFNDFGLVNDFHALWNGSIIVVGIVGICS